jgi:mannan endo-1,4-beta-mannosidase
MRVNGRFLEAPDGERIILKGANIMSVWTDPRGDKAMHNIAAHGGNSVRIVWLASGSVSDLDVVITRAIENRLIPMLEMHDATCDDDYQKIKDIAYGYLSQADVQTVLHNHSDKLLLNLANEAGASDDADSFRSTYEELVAYLRTTMGYDMPFVVDAPGCGQDIDTIRATHADITAADPDGNVLYAVHT